MCVCVWMGLFPDICVCVSVISVVDILPKKKKERKRKIHKDGLCSEKVLIYLKQRGKKQRRLVQRCLKLLGTLFCCWFTFKKYISAKKVIKKQ